jgi:D-alanyl-D-alanine carboxypeptidase/D-alanyl-D-alanine-endopeptidase (penicillin-binding protein 4)
MGNDQFADEQFVIYTNPKVTGTRVNTRINRRMFLGASLSGLGQVAFAGAPKVSLIPQPRPGSLQPIDPAAPAPLRDIIAEIALPGRTSYVVADARTGEVLESASPRLRLPPASVAKAITAQYTLETFGTEHRFATTVSATAPIISGRIDGDLILMGGGDPMLDTDDLGALATTLKELGLREITGRFLVSRGAWPRVAEIDPSQPDHVSYNPGVSGLNLNFNRVYFEWAREAGQHTVRMDARGEKYQPPIPMTRMEVVDRGGPVFDLKVIGSQENWTVARGALGKDGARWLPVRHPALYAGHAMRGILAAQGINLPVPVLTQSTPQATALAVNQSLPTLKIMRSMLYYSTNLIAEVSGLNTTIARGGKPQSLLQSGRSMGQWTRANLAADAPLFVDHSGLGDKTRVTTSDLVSALVRMGPDGAVASQLRRKGMPKQGAGIEVVAKTGTLNFVSGLAGFARANGRELAFAILAADLPRRRTIPEHDRERPPGAKSWSNRARHQENELLMEWARRYAS